MADRRTDTDIAAAAVRSLERDAFVSIDKFDVTVSNGWVTLKARSSGSPRRRTRSGSCAGLRA